MDGPLARPWEAWPAESSRVVERILGNIINAPKEPKFRRLRLENPKIAAVVGEPGAHELLQGVGWEFAENNAILVLPMTADLTLLEQLHKNLSISSSATSSFAPPPRVANGSAAGETWTVTVLRGPLRERLDLPFPAHLSALQEAVASSAKLGRIPKGRQRICSGYPPRPLGSHVRLADEAIKTVALEDTWEQLVAELRAGRMRFGMILDALKNPSLSPLVLGDYRDFVLDKAKNVFLAYHGIRENSPAPNESELRTSVMLLRRMWTRDHGSQEARLAFCNLCVRELGPARPPPGVDTGQAENRLVLLVDRSNIVQSAISQINVVQPFELRLPLQICFAGEAAEDAGGPRREFFNEFGRGMVQATGLWRLTPAGSLHPTSTVEASRMVPDSNARAAFYRGCGRVFGLALTQACYPPCDALLLGFPVTRAFIQALQREAPETLQDLQEELNRERGDHAPDIRGSPEFLARSLQELGLEGTLAFCTEIPGLGTVELVPGGSAVPVTDTNKAEWLRAALRHEQVDCFEEATDTFRLGVLDAVGVGRPPVESAHLALLTAEELSERWAGRSFVSDEDLAEWRSKTTISPAVARQAEWLFQLLDEDMRDDRGRVLKFATGSDRWPADTGSFEFTIEPMDGDDHSLPRAMTCGNMLQLPRYSRKEPLKDQLLKAIDLGMDLQVI